MGGGGEAGRHKAHTYWWGGRERGGEAPNGPQRSTNMAARGEEIAAEMMEGRRKTSDWESALLFPAFPRLGSTTRFSLSQEDDGGVTTSFRPFRESQSPPSFFWLHLPLTPPILRVVSSSRRDGSVYCRYIGDGSWLTLLLLQTRRRGSDDKVSERRFFESYCSRPSRQNITFPILFRPRLDGSRGGDPNAFFPRGRLEVIGGDEMRKGKEKRLGMAAITLSFGSSE